MIKETDNPELTLHITLPGQLAAERNRKTYKQPRRIEY
jgi:hypothetical protein